MSIPVDAKVRAVPEFGKCLAAARSFMIDQDPLTAAMRFKGLQAQLVEARALLSFAPTSGRPARLLEAKSGWGRLQAQRAMELAKALALPELREFVLARYVVLYAHSEKEVLLLSLRHERQLGYRLPPNRE